MLGALIRATAGAIGLLAGAAPAWAQRYWIEELPPASPYVWSFGSAIDEAGTVFGSSRYPSWYGGATRWEKGKPPEDLGTLAGWIWADPCGASDDGTRVVGVAPFSDHTVAFIWDGTLPPEQRLAELPAAPRDNTYAYQINGAGTIAVGDAYNGGPPWNDVACCWKYEDGGQQAWTLALLPPLAPWPMADAFGINESGVIVGDSADWNTSPYMGVACRWDPPNYDEPTQLPALGGPYFAMAQGINDFNQYVGVSSTPDGEYRAFFCDGTQCINLGLPPGYAPSDHSIAYRVNNGGTVIGWGYKGDPSFPVGYPDPNKHAFVWRRGVMTMLDEALVGGTGWYISLAVDINERGQIACVGAYQGQWLACRLTPAYGDLNCDGAIDAFDIDPFVLALTNPVGYEKQYPDCDALNGDINGDGKIDAFDIDPFVELLTGG